MRKFIKLFILSIMIAFSLTSCKQKTVRTVEKDDVEKYFLSSDTTKGALRIDISVEIPVCYDDSAVLHAIRNEIISNLFGPEYIKFPVDSVVGQFTKDLIFDYKDTNQALLEQLDSTSLYTFDNEHTLEGFSLLSDERIYSYGINRYVFMGGAHGLSTTNYFVFNLKNGKKITEKDIFVAGYEQKLSDLLKTRIIEQSKEDENTTPIISLEETDYWVDAIKPNGNFYVTDESINYVFNPYEIAPYYMGQTEVILPFDRLKSLLKANNPISYLVDRKLYNKNH